MSKGPTLVIGIGKAKPSVGEALSKGAPSAEGDAEQDEDAPSEMELSAMRAFEKAKTPEDKVIALRSFVQACGKDY